MFLSPSLKDETIRQRRDLLRSGALTLLPHRLICAFSISSCLQASVLFYYFCVPETRGKTLEQIAIDLAAEFHLPKNPQSWNT